MEALDVAKYIINKAIDMDKPISNLQLQKILYFAHLESLKQGEKLIDEPFEAWDLGPVIRSVYNEFCVYGANRLALKEECSIPSLPNIDSELIKLIETPSWDLTELINNPNSAWAKSHKEGEKNIIPDSLMSKEAKKLLGKRI